MSRTGMAVKKRTFSKIPKSRHYLLKSWRLVPKRKKNWQNHWVWLNEPFRNASKPMEMIQKQGNWVPYELKPRDVERCFFACEQLLQRQNRKGFFYIALWPPTKNGPTMIILSAENHEGCLDMPPRRRPDLILTVSRLYSVFSGTSSECWIKLSQGIGIERNWCVWAEHWRRNGHSTKRNMTKLSSSKTMLDHMSQDPSKQ